MAKVIVLNSIPSISSSIYVDLGDKTLLFDCGDGTLLSLLRSKLAFPSVIILSHDHSDHVSGLFALLSYSHQETAEVSIVFPRGSVFVNRIKKEIERRYGKKSFSFIPVKKESLYNVAGIEISPHFADHFSRRYKFTPLCYEVRFSGKEIFYTGDTAYFPELDDYSRNKDLVIAEATILKEEDGNTLYNIHMDKNQALSLKPDKGQIMIVHRGETNGEIGRKKLQF